MSRRNYLAVAVALVLATFSIRSVFGQPTNDLRGVWKLVSITQEGKDVPTNGWMVITREHYIRVATEKGRPLLEGIPFRTPEKLTPEQQRLVAMTLPRSNSNAGTYHIDGNTFSFTSVAHSNPDAEGHDFHRKIELNGTHLRLIQETGTKADERWERVEEIR